MSNEAKEFKIDGYINETLKALTSSLAGLRKSYDGNPVDLCEFLVDFHNATIFLEENSIHCEINNLRTLRTEIDNFKEFCDVADENHLRFLEGVRIKCIQVIETREEEDKVYEP